MSSKGWKAAYRVGQEVEYRIDLSNNFARAADAYVVIVQHPGEAAAFNLSDYGDDAPILTVDVAAAQMLARLAKRPVAAALRKATAELDRITSGGGS